MLLLLCYCCRCSPFITTFTMVNSRSRTSRLSVGSHTSSFRFSRAGFGLTVERPPIILEWDSEIIRVGHAEQHRPQHIFPWNTTDNTSMYSEEDWYFVIAPLLSKVWDRIMLDPSSRRVVCVTPSLYVSKAWEASMKQALWNLEVPAVCFISCLETVPYGMGWKRGLVVHVGKHEAQCLILADGASLRYTFQAAPCGYKMVVPDQDKVQVEWNEDMNLHWLDETNPNSLIMTLLKCLSTCPKDLRKDVISNLVFAGDAMVLVPDLARQVRNRLIAILNRTAVSFDKESTSEMTVVPIDCKPLEPLVLSVAVTTTAPLCPDLVSWVGASVWATVWHRRHDDDDGGVRWTFAPEGTS